MSEYPWNKKNNTFTWLSSLYNPFKIQKTIWNNLKYPRGVFRTQTSENKILRENSQQPRAINSFHKKCSASDAWLDSEYTSALLS